jgi:lipopolysaccharide export system protein LptC
MDDELQGILQEYVATANNQEYKGDYDIINSKFPELAKFDKKTLQEYVATANNTEYNGDYKVINSKFPEFSTVPVKKKDGPVLSSDGSSVSQESFDVRTQEKIEQPDFVDITDNEEKPIDTSNFKEIRDKDVNATICC